MGKVTCVACSKSCKGQAIRLQERYYHVKCFKCKECGQTLASSGFYTKDDNYYCVDDYRRLHGVHCDACDDFVEGDVVSALGRTFHEKCFHCSSCNATFAPGDKVTMAGERRYLCEQCSEEDRPLSPVTAAPTLRTSLSAPATPARGNELSASLNGNAGIDEHMSTPALDGSGDRILRNHLMTNGLREKNISVSVDGSFDRPMSHSSGDVFDDIAGGRYSRQHLSPIQNIMRYRSVSPGGMSQASRKSKDSLTSSTSRFEYGRFYQTSFLEKSDNGKGIFKRGPSLNTKEPSLKHFHLPAGGMSYGKSRKDMKGSAGKTVRSSSAKGGLLWKTVGKEGRIDRQYMSPLNKLEPYQPIKTQEPIQMSKIPDAKPEEAGRVSPIDRPDWPGPPDPAAAFPEFLRDARLRDGRDQVDSSMDKENLKKIDREIDELTKMQESGAAKVILGDLKRIKSEGVRLDPRSASRTPNAAAEPHFRTRYESSVFASPSRDTEMRERAQSSLDCLLIERKYRTTPLPTFNHSDMVDAAAPKNVVRYAEAPRPGYALRKSSRPASTIGDGIHGYSFDGFDHRLSWRPQSAFDVLRRASESDPFIDEAYDPTTGLRRHSRSSRMGLTSVGISAGISGGISAGMSENPLSTLRRSVPNLFRGAAEDFTPPKVYPYSELKQDGDKKKLPAGVDRNALEKHLAGEEFQRLFGMSAEAFCREPLYKRNDLKSKLGLIVK